MTGPSPSPGGKRRTWTDPLFFAILGTVGATYVVLIIAMLLADAVYLFTGERDVPVVLQFESDGTGKVLAAGGTIKDAFAAYGLKIETVDAQDQTPRIFDTSHASWEQRRLGTPNREFGGPGVGAGGGAEASNPNKEFLGKVLVVAKPKLADRRYECRFDFRAPARVESIHFHDATRDPVHVEAWSEGDSVPTVTLAPGSVDAAGPDEELRTLVLWSPTPFGEVDVDYRLSRTASSRSDQPTRETVAAMSIFVSDPESARIQPAEQGARVRFTWKNAVTLDQVTLLNLRASGKLILRAEPGARGEEFKIPAAGDNGVWEESLERRGVREAEFVLPPEAALAAMRFRWSGKVAGEWEEAHPVMAKWSRNALVTALQRKEIRYSIKLSLIACTMTTILSLWIAVPIGYLLSRYKFPFHNLIDAVLDIPIVLPPLVVGLSLLILFQFFPKWIQVRVVYEIPAVILAQLAVACAFAVRSMRASFDLIDHRREQVALTLGCTRAQAFFYVVLPEAGRGMLTAATLAWARALGEFGPLLIFAGATRMKTEVLSTTVFLELSVGDLGAAVAVSMIMVVAAIIVLVLARMWGSRALSI